jgi:RimJ/RimL family protein N-acetyltransferase
VSFSIETNRLLLRPFRLADAETLAAYRSDPLVAAYQSWDTPYRLEQATALIHELAEVQPGIPGAWFQIAIEERASGALLGDCVFCVLAEEPHQAEIGYTLARQHQGAGYASEAVRALLGYLFGTLGLHRVRAICDERNRASQRLLERLGMRREAHFVEYVWHKGEWASDYWYAMLRREWEG